MLVLSPLDIQSLSAGCRAELLQLVAGGRVRADDDLLNPAEGAEAAETAAEVQEIIDEEKTVVDLSVSDAKELLKNLSLPNREVLRLFASGSPVLRDALQGPGKRYEKYSQLKQGLVGAVNRRLRTVTGNRNAVMFSSDRDQTRIKVTPRTARSLRRALGMPEPLPTMNFCNSKGDDIEPSNPECVALNERLAQAWTKYDSINISDKGLQLQATVFKHMVDSGFALYLRTPISWDQDGNDIGYEVQTTADPSTVIESWKKGQLLDELFIGMEGDASVLAQPSSN